MVRGDDGHEIKIQRAAQRIISLAPHLTELVYAADASDRLIAVSAYSDFPEAARLLPQVGDASNLDLERIVMLKPDLVLAWKSNISPFAVERLRRPLNPIRIDIENIAALHGIEARMFFPHTAKIFCRRRRSAADDRAGIGVQQGFQADARGKDRRFGEYIFPAT